MSVLADSGTLGGSALASWTPLWISLGGFLVVLVVLYAVGRPSPRPWPLLQPLSRLPGGLTRVTGVPGWAATAIGLSLFGLLVAGQGFYSDVAWHIALGRDEKLLTAPHTGILLGLVLILCGAVLGTVVATMDRVEPALRLGALRVPRPLLPLWALGLGAVSGFPLDEVWHREYGVDVTMWSPTHMLMILGATFTGLAAWMILAGSGVKPTDGRWARGLHVVCAWLTIQGLLAPQGEFTFGVPQFSQLFQPILICLAAGFGLVAGRLVLGSYWMLGVVVVNFAIQLGGFGGDDGSPVETRFGATFLASAVVVEVLARLLGTDRRLRLAVASGVGIGTVGLAAEWLWNLDAFQPWRSSLFPEALLLGLVAAAGSAVLGAAFAAVLRGERPSREVSTPALLVAAVACLAVIVLPLRRPTGNVEAALTLEPAGDGQVVVEARLVPADAAADAYWFQVSAWQGGGLVLADMDATDTPGVYRADRPVPADGLWKTLLRLHRGREMMAIPVYLPDDPEIGEQEVPAVDRTAQFTSEREFLLRETHAGNGWLSPVVHGFLVAMATLWALAFVAAGRSATPPRGRPMGPVPRLVGSPATAAADRPASRHR